MRNIGTDGKDTISLYLILNLRRELKDEVPVDVSWTTRPTAEQEALLTKVKSNFPDEGDGIKCSVLRRNGHPKIQIINTTSIHMSGLVGFALRRTCKQVSSETSAILYGDNEYPFETAKFKQGWAGPSLHSSTPVGLNHYLQYRIRHQ